MSEREARQWLERVQSAWRRRDRAALRDLGEVPAAGRMPPGKVAIGDASVIVDATGANVWYDRIENGVATNKRARLVRDASGKIVRR